MNIQHIVPAIIPDSLEQIERKLRDMRGGAHRVQIDVMDGTYAPGKSWPYDGVGREAFEAIRREDDGLPYWQDFDFEIDLLLENPEERVEEWALAGAACLIAHVESSEHVRTFLDACKERRVEAALALKPSSDITLLEPHINNIVFVQVMGSERIGRHGVALDKSALEKIREMHATWPELLIGVDIGVNEETIPQLLEAGAMRFAAGSAVFETGDPMRAWKSLEAAASEYLNI